MQDDMNVDRQRMHNVYKWEANKWIILVNIENWRNSRKFPFQTVQENFI